MTMPLKKIFNISHTRSLEQETVMLGLKLRETNIHHNKLVPSFWLRWRRLLRHISEPTLRKLSLLFQHISMILRDKPLRMLVRLQTLRLRELSMSQPLLPLLLVWTRQMERLLPFTISVVELSISPFLRSQVVCLKSRPPMVILPLEEKTSILSFNNT